MTIGTSEATLNSSCNHRHIPQPKTRFCEPPTLHAEFCSVIPSAVSAAALPAALPTGFFRSRWRGRGGAWRAVADEGRAEGKRLYQKAASLWERGVGHIFALPREGRWGRNSYTGGEGN